MKYIKKFEGIIDPNIDRSQKFWLVRTDSPYFEISLNKMNKSDDEIQRFLNNQYRKDNAKLYIPINDYEGSWNSERTGKNSYTQDGFEYQGEMEVTPEEIEEWNMKNSIKKYNL